MIEIRKADLRADREALIHLLRRYLTPRSDERRYDWFYRQNPHGEAQVWIAVATDNGEIVGSAAIVPQQMWMQQNRIPACIMADFWVHPSHRVLGPALRLQRACIEGARTAGMALFLDLPQGAMPAVYKRLGVTPSTCLVRHTRPLRADPYVARWPLAPSIARLVSRGATMLLAGADPSARPRRGVVFGEEPAVFGAEFEALAERVSDEYPLCVARTAAYLTWRYAHHYFLKHHLIVARRGSILEAYTVLTIEGGFAQIVDLFGVRDSTTLRGLLAAAIRLARAHGAYAVNLPLLELDPFCSLAASMWFRARQASPVIVHSFVESSATTFGRPYLTYGDLDY